MLKISSLVNGRSRLHTLPKASAAIQLNFLLTAAAAGAHNQVSLAAMTVLFHYSAPAPLATTYY